MPNWCISTYYIVSENQNELRDLHEKLTTLQQLCQEFNDACCKARINNLPLPEPPSEIIASDFSFFLGIVVKAFGGNYEDFNCRGAIIDVCKLEDGYFRLDTETAWGEKNEVWDFVMSKYEDVSYYYQSEEPGNLHFVTNDTTKSYFPEEYYIYDSVLSQTEYANSDEELLHYMAGTLEVEKIESIKELDKLLEEFEDNNPDECLYYAKFYRESR